MTSLLGKKKSILFKISPLRGAGSILFKDDKPQNSQGQSNNQSLRQSLTSQPFPLPNCDDLILETSTLRENLGSQVQSIGWDKAGGQFGTDL